MNLLSTNHVEELLKINHAVVVGVRFVNHLAKFLIRGKLAERSHYCTELDRSNASITILRSSAEEIEGKAKMECDVSQNQKHTRILLD